MIRILIMASDGLQHRYPWARIVQSPDTIVPHRVPFPLARRFHQICATVLAETLADEELPAPLRYAALACVDDFPGIDQRRLALLAGIDRTNVGQIVDELEAKGLVERRINGADRRARQLYPTPRGRDLRRRMRPKMLAGQARILQALTPKERELLIDLLTRVIEANEAHARPGAGRRPPRKRGATTSPKGERHDQDSHNVQARTRGGPSAR
jgi:MarR family transcriptional regulator, temperature-dependent positive regulator of motility